MKKYREPKISEKKIKLNFFLTDRQRDSFNLPIVGPVFAASGPTPACGGSGCDNCDSCGCGSACQCGSGNCSTGQSGSGTSCSSGQCNTNSGGS